MPDDVVRGKSRGKVVPPHSVARPERRKSTGIRAASAPRLRAACYALTERGDRKPYFQSNASGASRKSEAVEVTGDRALQTLQLVGRGRVDAHLERFRFGI